MFCKIDISFCQKLLFRVAYETFWPKKNMEYSELSRVTHDICIQDMDFKECTLKYIQKKKEWYMWAFQDFAEAW